MSFKCIADFQAHSKPQYPIKYSFRFVNLQHQHSNTATTTTTIQHEFQFKTKLENLQFHVRRFHTWQSMSLSASDN